MRSLISVLAIAVTSIAIGGGVAMARRTVAAQPRIELPQPPAWVAFSARVEVQRGDSTTSAGFFYRSSDGSTRLETGPSERNIRVISINNVPSRTAYLGVDDQWKSSPMAPNSAEFQPQRFHAAMPLLAAYPKKINILKGQTYSLSSESGFSAYQLMTTNGGLLLLVPELNFFPVIRERLDGRREVYTDISLESPDPKLFLPPPGTAVAVVLRQNGAPRAPAR